MINVREKIVKWTLPTLKTFVHQRIFSRKEKEYLQNGRKYCVSYI
jgi:hypothetical protein